MSPMVTEITDTLTAIGFPSICAILIVREVRSFLSERRARAEGCENPEASARMACGAMRHDATLARLVAVAEAQVQAAEVQARAMDRLTDSLVGVVRSNAEMLGRMAALAATPPQMRWNPSGGGAGAGG